MRSKFPTLRWIAALTGVLLPVFSHAADFNLNNITAADYDALVREMSANSQYTSVTPASSLGGLWGFEFGVTGGITKAPDVQGLVLRSDPTSSFKPNLYHAGALARIGLPFGLTAEGLYIPKTKISSAKIGRWALAAQWTATDNVLQDLPVILALKGYLTKTTLEYSQVINNSSTLGVPVTATIGFEDVLYGLQAIASYKILVFEPYVGLGYTKAKGDLNIAASGTTTFLNIGDFGQSQSASSKQTSVQILGGLDVRLLFLSLGAEYERAFSRNSYTGRVSFRF